MHVSNREKAIFLAIPKTASRTVAEWLHKDYNFKKAGGRRHGRTPHHGLCPTVQCKLQTQDYFHFTAIRNPFSRMVSRWNHWRKGHKQRLSISGFHKYLDGLMPEHVSRKKVKIFCARYLSPQTHWIDYAGKYLDHEITTIKQENLIEGLKNLPFVTKPIVLPEIGKNDYGKWQDYYTPKLRRKIVELYWEDFSRFGYQTSF